MTVWNTEDRFSPRPRASAVPAEAPSEARRPLGFVHTHESEVEVPSTGTAERLPFGFAPREDVRPEEMPQPVWRTEVSFRVDRPAPHMPGPQVVAQSHDDVGPAGSSFEVGHAWSNASQPAEKPAAEEMAVEIDEPMVEEHLDDEDDAAIQESRRRGFFRRRKTAEPATSEDPMELEPKLDTAPDVPFEPIEVKAPESEGLEELDAPHKVPFYKRDLSFRQRRDEDVEVQLNGVAAEPADPAESQDEPTDAEPHEAETFVVVESEEHPVDETPVHETPVPETPVHEPQVFAADEVESAQVNDEPSEEAEPPVELDAVEETAPEPSAPVAEPEPEPEHEPESDATAVVQAVPAALPRRNGGGGQSRGKKVVGLKVGASQIAAAVVSGGGDQPALVDLARHSLEPGVVVDGELRDPEALSRALKSFFKDHGLPHKNVRIGLSSSRIGVRLFDIAGIDDESRFDNAVRFKAHEVLPVAAHESVLDYRVVEERYMETGEVSRRVLLVVAPRDQIEPYIEACRTAGLRLAGVDLEAFGLLRAFVPPFGARSRSDDSATVVVAVGHEASTLLVAGGGVCEFTRVFDWGGGALQAAIADELDVPLMEAATILTHLSLSGPGRHLDSLDADARSRALEAVRTRLMPFARELVSSLQFYQTQPESLGIREILITGGTSHLEGLADALHQMIGVSVRVGDPLGRVTVQTEIPHALDATIGSMAVPIGLAIEDESARSVNLLPKDARQTRKRPNVLALAAPVAAVVPIAALAFLFIQANGTSGDRQAELNAVRAEIAALPKPTRPTIDPALVGEQAVRAQAVAQVLGGRLTWERVLGDISRVLPPNVSLTELGATAPPPTTPETVVPGTEDTAASAAPPPAAVPAVPTGVTVTGYALDYATIARTLARIQAVPSLTNAQLQSATPKVIGQKRIIEFTILANLALPGGAQ